MALRHQLLVAATPVIALSGAAQLVGYRSHVSDNALRFGLNYRFSGT